jgi:ribonuclease P/MRP protein subunit RPP40
MEYRKCVTLNKQLALKKRTEGGTEWEISTWEDVLSRVPQGSVLGPILFVIFIDDLDDAVETTELIKKFADDTKMRQTQRTADDAKKLQRTLVAVKAWASEWGLDFNVGKRQSYACGLAQ